MVPLNINDFKICSILAVVRFVSQAKRFQQKNSHTYHFTYLRWIWTMTRSWIQIWMHPTERLNTGYVRLQIRFFLNEHTLATISINFRFEPRCCELMWRRPCAVSLLMIDHFRLQSTFFAFILNTTILRRVFSSSYKRLFNWKYFVGETLQ